MRGRMPRVNMWEAMPGTADEGGGKDEIIDDVEAKGRKKSFIPLANAQNVFHSQVILSTRQER